MYLIRIICLAIPLLVTVSLVYPVLATTGKGQSSSILVLPVSDHETAVLSTSSIQTDHADIQPSSLTYCTVGPEHDQIICTGLDGPAEIRFFHPHLKSIKLKHPHTECLIRRDNLHYHISKLWEKNKCMLAGKHSQGETIFLFNSYNPYARSMAIRCFPATVTELSQEEEGKEKEDSFTLYLESENHKSPAVQVRLKSTRTSKRFRCDQCNYATDNSGNFKKHKRIHLSINERSKPLKCDQCSYATDNSRGLNRHKKTHLPINERPKPFKCDQCSYATDRSDHLNRHKRTHPPINERPKPFKRPV